MPRPKGSKNKKSIVPSAKVVEQITSQQKVIDVLNNDLATLTAEVKEKQAAVKAKKVEIRKAEKVLVGLKAKKEESDAIEAAAAQKAEIEKVVSKLISSGKGADEILELLKK